jgi:PAS domain S-box-containing protein
MAAAETDARLRPESPTVQRIGTRLREALDALPVAVYLTDANGIVTYSNRVAADLVGRQPAAGVDRWSVAWRLYTPDGNPLAVEESPMAIALTEKRAIRNMEILVERPDRSLVSVLPVATPLFDGNGKLLGGVITLIDVSERKYAEAGQLGLLRELNHRVKNNMQMLLSLLSSAAREAETVETQKALLDAARRVAVMGAVQQVLYGGDDSGMTFRAEKLIRAVAALAPPGPHGPVDITVVPTPLVLTNDTAVPVALVLNELLSNAARFGGRSGQPAAIRVELTRTGDRFSLVVEDDGPGFDPDPASTKRASGLGLVRGLARQLGGTLSVEKGGGARCTVTFSDRSFH